MINSHNTQCNKIILTKMEEQACNGKVNKWCNNNWVVEGINKTHTHMLNSINKIWIVMEDIVKIINLIVKLDNKIIIKVYKVRNNFSMSKRGRLKEQEIRNIQVINKEDISRGKNLRIGKCQTDNKWSQWVYIKCKTFKYLNLPKLLS